MDVYSLLSHPLRQKLLRILEKEGFISYSELMEKLGLETTGQLNFHLKKLGDLIKKDKKSYYLTEEGRRIIKIMDINKRVLAGEEIEYEDSRKSEISRVGVVICDCNTEISTVVDVGALENYVKKVNGVVSVKFFDNLCSEKNFKEITDWCKDNYLNKIVIAACSPRTHRHVFERIFEGIVEHANIEIANIREQCCWVHEGMDLLALKKAQILIEAAIERVKIQKNVSQHQVAVEKSCAILGGGIAGMTIALNLARAGIKVYLIEKSPTLGGKVARWHRIYGIGDCSICFLSELIGELVIEENIEILTNTELESVSGEIGNFTLDLIKKPRFVDEQKCTGCKQCTIICPDEKNNQYEFGLIDRKLIYIPFTQAYPYVAVIDEDEIETCRQCRICERTCTNKAINLDQKPEKIRIKVGTKVIAIGSDLYSDLKRYKYNPKNDIITSPEFERILSSDGPTEGNIVLSDGTLPLSIGIIHNLKGVKYRSEFGEILIQKYLECINQKHPFCKVDVFFELNGSKEVPSTILSPMDKRVHYVENLEIDDDVQKFIVADSIKYPSDIIVLNVNVIPNKDLKELRKSLDFTLNDKGFMSEETLASGIFGIGTVMGPLNYQSTIAGANEIALKIIALLSQDYIIAESSGIEIYNEKCGLCGLCVISCPYNAIILEKDKISVDQFKCKGCGTCVSVCPTKAVEMKLDATENFIKTIEILSKSKSKPKVIAFCCQSCGYTAADEAGLKKIPYNPNVFIVRVPCTGRVDSSFIFKAYELGFDGVIVIGCTKNSCRYIDGVKKINKKIKIMKNLLGSFGKSRLKIRELNAVEGGIFAAIVNKFYSDLEEEIKNEA